MDHRIGRFDFGESIAFESKSVLLHAFRCFATWKHCRSVVGNWIHPSDSNLLNHKEICSRICVKCIVTPVDGDQCVSFACYE